jgi:hypothetical protein
MINDFDMRNEREKGTGEICTLWETNTKTRSTRLVIVHKFMITLSQHLDNISIVSDLRF